jgi:hypothetical protein
MSAAIISELVLGICRVGRTLSSNLNRPEMFDVLHLHVRSVISLQPYLSVNRFWLR